MVGNYLVSYGERSGIMYTRQLITFVTTLKATGRLGFVPRPQFGVVSTTQTEWLQGTTTVLLLYRKGDKGESTLTASNGNNATRLSLSLFINITNMGGCDNTNECDHHFYTPRKVLATLSTTTSFYYESSTCLYKTPHVSTLKDHE